MMTVSPEDAVNNMLPQLARFRADKLYLIIPLTDVKQCVTINADIGNVPTGGIGIAWIFALEQMFFRSFEY